MKSEIYSCLKMLEVLSAKIINIHNINNTDACFYLAKEYNKIRSILKKHLSKDQFEFIPEITGKDFSGYYNPNEVEKGKRAYIIEIGTASDLAKSYLNSLEMSLDKELIKQKSEMRLKEKELELKEKELDHMQKLLSKSLKAIENFPELQRSKVMADIKKNHRDIEKNTNPHTKSQNK